MMKNLAIIGVFGAFLLGWPCVAENQQAAPHASTAKATHNKQPVPPTHIVIDPPLPPSASKPEPADSQSQTPEKPLPRFERPEWVIVYITAIYVLIAWWTLRTIKRQADTMEKQLADAKESGKHTEELAKQAVRQADLTKLQLDISHRPWIAIESIAVASDLTFNEQGCILVLNLQIRNVGGAIAKHVINFVDYAVGGVADIRDVTAKVIEVLKKPIPPELDHGKLLFPGEADLSQYPVVIRSEHIETALKSGHFKEQKGIGFELIVCFDYQSTIDPGVHHQTRRTYGVAEIPEGGGALMGIFRPAVKVYPAQRIAIFYRGYGAHID